ncbi:MAG: transporter substrate-binding domain-containing protein [Dongiaceae bacterium]
MKQFLGFLVAGTLAIGFASEGFAQSEGLKVLIGGAFPPWSYTEPSGEIKGFDVDFQTQLCEGLGVQCTIDSLAFDASIPALDAGKYDMIIDALGVTEARKQIIDFSVPYAAFCYSFASVNSNIKAALPMQDEIMNLDDGDVESALRPFVDAFQGATIGTQTSGTSTRFVAAHLAGITTKAYQAPEDRNLDLKAGRIDVIFASKDSLLALKQKENIDTLELIGPCLRGDLLGSGAVAVGLKKGNTELKEKINPIIEKLVANGTISDMSVKYFGIDMSPVGLK